MLLRELKCLILLSAPIIAAQLARTAMSVVDIVMSGHYSTNDLAAVSLGSSIWFPIFILGYGIIIMLAADAAKHVSEDDSEGLKDSINAYLFISLILSVPIILLLFGAVQLLGIIGVDERVLSITKGYVTAMAFGVPGVLVFNVFRSLLQGLEDTRVAMYISILALLVNIPLNYALIFGEFGMPELGGVGAGITTAIINTLSAVLLVLYFISKKEYRRYRFRLTLQFNLKVKAAFWIGAPSGLALFFEMVFLDIMTFGIAPLGPSVISANNIMLNVSMIIFTVTSGVATAATVRVSALASKRDFKALRRFCSLALKLISIMAIAFGVVIYFWAESIIALYTTDASVISAAVGIIVLLCLFQFFDSMQAAFSGILRGLHATKSLFYVPLFGYWIVGIPVGFVSGLTDLFGKRMGLEGFWYGLVFGLAFNAVALFALYRFQLRVRGPSFS